MSYSIVTFSRRLVALSGGLLLCTSGYAAQWTESGDAGQLPATAQVTSGPAGQALTSISGSILSTDDVDLYRISIVQPTSFSAAVSGGDNAPFDSVLALFDAEGFGVYYNDDRAPNDGNSLLPAGNTFSPMTPGIYYLAIFSDFAAPLSGTATSENDLIFPLPDEPFTAVVGPTAPGGSAPLTTWLAESSFTLGNGYQISLTGAEFAEMTLPQGGPIVASVLPASRSVQVGDAATAFATIINTGQSAATGCSIAPLATLPANFTFQTTDPATNALTGTADTPVDIAGFAAQSFVFAFTPFGPISPMDYALSFDCTNTDAAATIVGVNTLLLVADSNPVPDIVALGGTPSGDGIVNVINGAGAFVVAVSNVGIAGSISVSADTGAATLPITVAICETDPVIGSCINPTVPTTDPVTLTINANATPTFGFFVGANAEVPLDAANNRIFVRFRDAGAGNITRGSTSVAVRTQ